MKIKESEKRDKYLDLARELKKSMEHEGDTNNNWCVHSNQQRLGKETGRIRKQRSSGDHPNYSIIKISQNTEKSSEDLRRLAVAQTTVKDHQVTLV